MMFWPFAGSFVTTGASEDILYNPALDILKFSIPVPFFLYG
jgi:hypothetical protein